MAKQKKETNVAEMRDDLSSLIVNSINKTSKDYKIAFYMDGSEEIPTDFDDWISTGSDILDLIICNRPNGGLPAGRIIEILGWEASGKTLLCSHIAASTQKKGGLVVYMDSENSVNADFLHAIGVDTCKEKFIYMQPEIMEDVFTSIETVIAKVKENNLNRLITIFVDSATGFPAKADLEAGHEVSGYSTHKARLMSSSLPKIVRMIGRENVLLVFTSQFRTKVGITFGNSDATNGGNALKFYAGCRIKTAKKSGIKAKINGEEQLVGLKLGIEIMKNRFGPPQRKTELDLYFDSGIDELSAWLDTMVFHNIVNQGGAWYSYTDKETGEIIKFQKADFQKILVERNDIKQKMYSEICDAVILKYKSKDNILSYNKDDIKYDNQQEAID